MHKKNQPIKVMLLITDLSICGAQRIVINLHNYFDRRVINSSIVAWSKEGKLGELIKDKNQLYETDIGLFRPRFLFRLFCYLKLIKKIKPDIIFSFTPATNVSMTLIKPFISKKIGIITSEHAFISKAVAANEYRGWFLWLYRLLFNKMYNRVSDSIVMVSQVAKKDIVENWGINADKIQVIYNPVDRDFLLDSASKKLDDKWLHDQNNNVFIAVGRLTPQKGFDSLLQAFAQINQQNTPSKLLIIGEGEVASQLRLLAKELNIENNVRFLGFQDNHYPYIKKASFLVLSSIWEALPMVLVEAMTIGVPVIAFDCESGPSELLENGNCGFLVPDQDIDALARAMVYGLDNYDEALKKAHLAAKRVEEFAVNTVVSKYQKLIIDTSMAV